MRSEHSRLLTLLLSGILAACGVSTNDEAVASENALEAPADGTLDPANATRGGFVYDKERSVGVRGKEFKSQMDGQRFLEIGKACISGCESLDDARAETDIWGDIYPDDGLGDVLHFQNTSFVQWDNVTIKAGDSLEYRWAFLRFDSFPQDTIAMVWFIDDAGNLVKRKILSSISMLADNGNQNQTEWTKETWVAGADFHGSVRFSLSAGYRYGTQLHHDQTMGTSNPHGLGHGNPGYGAVPHGLLLLDGARVK